MCIRDRYGQEGTDYKVVDGVACNTDGTDLEDDYLSKLCLDLFINVYPVTGERSVSYTHLDVYKRQLRGRCNRNTSTA